MDVATITKTPSKTWKAVIRKRGWPVTIKTFRTKRDAVDWARSTEDEMVRGMYINRAGAERLLFDKALERYLAEVSASKRESTAYGESRKAKALRKKFDAYSLAAITAGLVAEYRDERLAAGKSADDLAWARYLVLAARAADPGAHRLVGRRRRWSTRRWTRPSAS